ncbi:PP2C family protein-serine/threonine phosphatase [Kitasatospora sp. NPDC004745]|uniref:PP2C family protein-serine/threonine phosphatase n=1 Tax=Kitasatospora sp. NPDC004745 TaxID=3364019 RepID=UPI0036956347
MSDYIRETFGVYLDVDGDCDNLDYTGGTEPREIIDFHLGPNRAVHRLGERATFFVSGWPYRQSVNRYAEAAWRRLSGGSQPPQMRGLVIVTGPVRPGGAIHLIGDREHLAVLDAADTVPSAYPGPVEVGATQLQGTRRQQNDAFAVHHDHKSGVHAWAVLDGIGDDRTARDAVRDLAPRLAQAAAEFGDPAAALRLIRAQTLEEHGHPDRAPSAVAVVATYHPWWGEAEIAWSGDVRAYRQGPDGVVTLLTAGHNAAQRRIAAGKVPGVDDHDLALSWIADGPIGRTRTPARSGVRLLLCSGGVYRPLENAGPQGVANRLDLPLNPQEATGLLVSDAVEAAGAHGGAVDNATALIVQFHGELVSHWR